VKAQITATHTTHDTVPQALDMILQRIACVEDMLAAQKQAVVATTHMTQSEICKYLKISKPHLIRLQKNGLPHYYTGSRIHFDLQKVIKFLEDKNLK
jgi:excisionase family DNA binding protein